MDGPDRVTASWHDDDGSKREVGPHRNVKTSLVRLRGLEPRTCGLRVRCSAIELEAHREVYAMPEGRRPAAGPYVATEGARKRHRRAALPRTRARCRRLRARGLRGPASVGECCPAAVGECCPASVGECCPAADALLGSARRGRVRRDRALGDSRSPHAVSRAGWRSCRLSSRARRNKRSCGLGGPAEMRAMPSENE